MADETTPYDDAILKIATIVLRIINIVLGVMILVLLGCMPFVFLHEAELTRELAENAMQGPGGSIAPWVVLLMAAAIAILVLAMRFFGSLLKLMATVREGDPFVPENARRLRTMAWLLLAMEVTGCFTGLYAGLIFKHSYGFELSITGMVAVLSLFVLARVFARGTAMRDEIEGTV